MIIELEINYAFIDTNFIMLPYIPSAYLFIYRAWCPYASLYMSMHNKYRNYNSKTYFYTNNKIYICLLIFLTDLSIPFTMEK